MAYVSFADRAQDAVQTAHWNTASIDPPSDTRAAARFSALEWSVVALAERDRLSSLRAPGRLSMALGTLFGDRPNPRLADPRLEALRRLAVLTRHYGYQVPASAIRAFLAAGFSIDHYELLAASVVTASVKRRERRTAA